MAEATMSIKYIDTLEYVRKAKELRDPEALAECQVKKIESAIETAVLQTKSHLEAKDLATKMDLLHVEHKLELKISRLQHNLLKSVIWTGGALFASLGGMIAHGFGWM
jgi:hypothetical protein